MRQRRGPKKNSAEKAGRETPRDCGLGSPDPWTYPASSRVEWRGAIWEFNEGFSCAGHHRTGWGEEGFSCAFPSLVFVHSEFPSMKAIFPRSLEPDDVGRLHVGRNPLQYRKSKARGVTTAKFFVSAVSTRGVVQPAPEDVVASIGRTDVSLPVGLVQDEVDAPATQIVPPSI